MKKRTLLGILAFVILIFILLSGCIERSAYTIESNGVTVHINEGRINGRIENTNKFSVRIKQTSIGSFSTEHVDWIKVFEPNEIKDQTMHIQSAWYIYTMDGVEIGFIKTNSFSW